MKEEEKTVDPMKPKKNIFPYKGKSPKIDPTAYIAPTAIIIGDVEIGAQSSIWFNTVIRGDVHYIKIGTKTNIQDLVMVHVTNGKWPTIIEDEVSIAHGAILHGCIIHSRCLIGIGAIILDGAEIGEGSIVGAGSVVKEMFKAPPNSLIAGVPAEVKRELSQKDIERIMWHANNYVEYRKIYMEEFDKEK